MAALTKCDWMDGVEGLEERQYAKVCSNQSHVWLYMVQKIYLDNCDCRQKINIERDKNTRAAQGN